ncbi:MAG: hypothetical protein ACMUJI_00920 [Erythrobacter sp.]|uniref:hypothetical protein n=1 Tax=Erythrobacter sp. TaxID=1042 RepID=UPI003A84FDF4
MGSKVRVNWGKLCTDEPVALHVVWNSAGRRLHVFAKDRESAIQIAHTANHIHHMDNGYSSEVSCFKISIQYLGEFEKFRKEIEFAISARFQGTVDIIDGQLFVGELLIQA